MNHYFTYKSFITELCDIYQNKINRLELELKKQKLEKYKLIINDIDNVFRNTQCFGLIIQNENNKNIINCNNIDELINILIQHINNFLSCSNYDTKIYFYWMYGVDPNNVSLDMILTFSNYINIIHDHQLYKSIIKKINELGYETDHFIFDILRKYDKIKDIVNWNKHNIKETYYKLFNKYTKNDKMIQHLLDYEKYKLKVSLENQLYNQKN